MAECVVVDYGIGNVYSVLHAVQACGANVELTSDHSKIMRADRLILPGVGAFGRAADQLRETGLDEALLNFAASGRPLLGICVGMQLMMKTGLEFGVHAGLGLFDGEVAQVANQHRNGTRLRVPLIGWSPLSVASTHSPDRWNGTPLEDCPAENGFYFVHSFAAKPNDSNAVLAITKHGETEVVAAIQRDNIIGVQFHPERSADQGLKFLDGFLAL